MRSYKVTGVQTCALPILRLREHSDHVAPQPPVLRPAVYREDRGRVRIARLGDVEGDARGEIGRASCREREQVVERAGPISKERAREVKGRSRAVPGPHTA